MSRRTIATIRRPDPHPYQESDQTPGCCHRCRLPEANGVHDQAAVAALEADRDAAQAEQLRRIGGDQ
ncbi:hypothetical protein GA0074692_6826 [Micromonospora pallida]|uniref:Uncharacterized protein n=1 Tax=Micromonospora pallida TaxID=145854 RepID=A0A1C6RH78_9ACTN|nr:hypothetical protein [Micromonospora pallida]SCL16453.1 hypothetical protein GA0074692_0033 [Micromonospora pallida]SCL43333.1 hypothetical protein GA0074692_6826 [Micromonospora pallida]